MTLRTSCSRSVSSLSPSLRLKHSLSIPSRTEVMPAFTSSIVAISMALPCFKLAMIAFDDIVG